MKKLFPYIIIFSVWIMESCKKSSFLEKKPDYSLVIPSKLSDFQAILDNDNVMNGAALNVGLVPSLGEIGSDGYYLSDADYNKMIPLFRKCYTWDQTPYSGETILDWDLPYRCVFYSNEVLDGMPKIKISPDQQEQANNIVGSALFYRAHMFYHLAQVFAPPYSSGSASTDLGIPLQLHADINSKVERSSLQQTYELVINDLKQALQLLPVTPLYKTRPSKPAVYSLLARVYMTMGDYDNCLKYSDSCLSLYNKLIDYNTLRPTRTFPIRQFNDEVIFNSNLIFSDGLHVLIAKVDSTLYNSYQSDDLRKIIFFKPGTGGANFYGSYDGFTMRFAGLATDEVFLMRAESRARKGNTADAMADLNTVLINRWKTGTYVPFTASNSKDALDFILNERRKELFFRGLRWIDLRRLNKEASSSKTLYRVKQGQLLSLPPNDKKYTYPIPDDVMHFNPKMQQNPR